MESGIKDTGIRLDEGTEPKEGPVARMIESVTTTRDRLAPGRGRTSLHARGHSRNRKTTPKASSAGR